MHLAYSTSPPPGAVLPLGLPEPVPPEPVPPEPVPPEPVLPEPGLPVAAAPAGTVVVVVARLATLALARSDRGLTSRELVDLEAAAQDAIDQTGPAARASGVVVEADLSAAPTLGDRVLVERLAANLVDNAVRYNVPGGSVQVETGTVEGHSYLSVTNTGPVVPQSKVASLFEPFTRLDQRVSNGQGAGLGLSIVASVVSAHNGHLEAAALPGGGLKITVRFPTTALWPRPAILAQGAISSGDRTPGVRRRAIGENGAVVLLPCRFDIGTQPGNSP